jgi:hypothetical protein
VLYPGYAWKFIESQWQNNKPWITAGRRVVKSLWNSAYKQQPVSEAISPLKKTERELNTMEAYRMRGLAKARSQSRKVVAADEFDRYNNQAQVDTENPLYWWRTIRATEYPHLV